ncbi:hypothetical protein SNEBB_007382, partial [Seison nebaliae]
WNEIIDVVDQVISRPDIKTKLPETFAGNYLAMELIKSTGANGESVYRSNFLEYFSRLTFKSEEPSEPSNFWQLAYSVTRFEIVGNALNQNQLKKCNDETSQRVRNYFHLIYEHLFSMLNEPILYKDIKNNNTFVRLKKYPDFSNYYENLLSFYEDIHFWHFSLINDINDTFSEVLIRRPSNEIIKVREMLKFVSDDGNDYIRNLPRKQLPYWMLVNYDYNIPKLDGKPLPFITIDPPYFGELSSVLCQNKPGQTLQEKIIKILVPTRQSTVAFDYTNPLTDIPIFDELFPDNTADDHYDITGILFGFLMPFELLDFSEGIPPFNGTEAQMFFIDECLTDVEIRLNEYLELVTPEEKKQIIKKNYKQLESFMRKLFTAFCAHKLKFFKVNSKRSTEEGHAVSLIRSYDKEK